MYLDNDFFLILYLQLIWMITDALINQMYPTLPAIVSSTTQHKTGNTVDLTPNNMVG